MVTQQDVAFLAGKVVPATLRFFERLAVKMVKSPLGDERDRDRIRRWADGPALKCLPATWQPWAWAHRSLARRGDVGQP